MTTQQFGPISLQNIARGALAQKLDERLREAAQKLCDYVSEGGHDLTKKAKATVTLKVDLVHLEAGMFTVRGDVTEKAPTVPLPATDRLVMGEENGVSRLYMPLAPELNERDDPRQMTLAMQDNPTTEKKELGK